MVRIIVGISKSFGFSVVLPHPRLMEGVSSPRSRAPALFPRVPGQAVLQATKNMRGRRAQALWETEHDRAGPEQELSRFSYRYCHLLPYYHYYTLPSLCLCIFPFGHNWGLFCLLITDGAIRCLAFVWLQ